MLLSLFSPVRALHDCADKQKMLPDRALMCPVVPTFRLRTNVDQPGWTARK